MVFKIYTKDEKVKWIFYLNTLIPDVNSSAYVLIQKQRMYYRCDHFGKKKINKIVDLFWKKKTRFL